MRNTARATQDNLPPGGLENLRRPVDFVEENGRIIRSYAAFRRQLDKRFENGLLESGAVIESRLGLLIDPERFRDWLLQPRGSSRRS